MADGPKWWMGRMEQPWLTITRHVDRIAYNVTLQVGSEEVLEQTKCSQLLTPQLRRYAKRRSCEGEPGRFGAAMASTLPAHANPNPAVAIPKSDP